MSLTRHNEQVTPSANAGQGERGGVSSGTVHGRTGSPQAGTTSEEHHERCPNSCATGAPRPGQTNAAIFAQHPGQGDVPGRVMHAANDGLIDPNGPLGLRWLNGEEVVHPTPESPFVQNPTIRSLRAENTYLNALAAQVRAEWAGRGVRHPQGGSR